MKDVELNESKELTKDALQRLKSTEESEATLQDRLRLVEATSAEAQISDIKIKEDKQRVHDEEVSKLREQVDILYVL